MKSRPRKHTDRVRYVASVLFLHGLSERLVAEKMTESGVCLMTKGKVSGIINQTPFRGLSDPERQTWLDRLAQKRLDDGVLPAAAFRAASRDARGVR
ncbi:hypothetical protein [Mangrovibrevibacter kandeliae]|uniref:hypothetical protein n=1 Tax=Mangrovibrevibacter kandeliae TaxID=2968473 RepID=UPI002117C612|nr:hypothetical protein [Aurantimonas sp. CSK15Z-1]MCQ8781686.1 hypothetical protein [Aurantimonas sp. CSK15Z-1]